MSTSGSVEEITFAGRTFNVPADADFNIKIGGFENEVLPNGNGTLRLKKVRVASALSGGSLEIDPERGDLVWLQERANSKIFEVTTIKLVGGTVYQGEMQITGEFQLATQDNQVPCSFNGTVLTAQ